MVVRRKSIGKWEPSRRVRCAVFKRDRYTCQICGWQPTIIPINYDGRFTIVDSVAGRQLELDHVHPASKGGQWIEENLQTLCDSCNASKGARVHVA